MSILKYYDELEAIIKKIKAVDKSGSKISFDQAVQNAMDLILKQHAAGKKLMFIGNGGSAGIASHMAVDFWKNGGIKAIAFNDPSLLTCISNDCGYQSVFEKPVEMFAEAGDILIAISSSGRSENIQNGVKAARAKGCLVVTLSGFNADNPLCKTGDINFYVPSGAYGHVEVVHQTILHYLLDMIIEKGGYQGDQR
jgi:D-sedoheptulose 7-phosphate isomerase